VLAWNNTARFREPFNVQWDFLGIYTSGQYVRYGNEIYRCSAVTCIGTPSVSAEWVQENIMKVEFRGLIANQDEFRYQGNANGPTIVRTDSTYTRGGKTLPYYAFGTNVNYNGCPSCNSAEPAAYMEFVNTEDVRWAVGTWRSTLIYYIGDLARVGNSVYRSTVNNMGFDPSLYPQYWQNVTNEEYANAEIFHMRNPDNPAQFISGVYGRGQYTRINRPRSVSFSGLEDGQQICQFESLALDLPNTSTGTSYELTGDRKSVV